MAGKLTRFLNLERARKPGDTPPAHGVATKARFTDEAPPPVAPDEHFRAERAGQLESGVEIDVHPAGEQPFLRCPLCEADNSKYAARCINCQARLDTDEVHDWNARLWKERQQQRALEPGAPPPPSPQQQRQLGEAIAQQVAESERARTFWSSDSTPLGLRLLELIPDPNLRFGVAMGLVAAFFGSGLMVYLARGHSALQAAGTIAALALFILFVPGRRRRSRWWYFDDD
jgi:hypothetical protein